MSAANANIKANSTMLNHLQYNCFTIPDGQQLIGADGKLNPNATLGRTYEYNGEKYYMTADDWNDAAYKNALRQEYNVSAKGMTDRSSFYVSLGYLNEDGIIDRSSYERITGRIKADYQAKKWLKLGVNAQYVNSMTKSNPNLSTSTNSTNLMYFTSSIAPIYPIYIRQVDENGNIYIKKDQYGHEAYDYGLPSGYGVTRPFLSTGNPLGNNRYNDVKSGFNQINASVFADVIFTDWLKFNATSTVIYGISDYTNYQNCYEGPKVGVNGELTKSNTSSTRTNNVQTLVFNKSFGDHNVDAMIGHEYYKSKGGYLASIAEGGFSPSIEEIDAFAYNKEKFFNVDWVDELKVKASLGQQGNDNIGSYAYIDLYSLSKASNTQMSPSFYLKGNKDITWETTTNLNIGLEFSLFKSRLTGSVDFYSKKTTDLLFWLSLPESQGTRGYYGNIGDIRNNGIELTLTGAIIRTKDIDWTVTANLAHNSTKILKLPEQKTKQYGGFKESNAAKNFQYWYREGGPLYNAFLPEYAGVNEQGEALYWVDAEIDGNNTTPGVQPGKSHDYTTTNVELASYYEQGSLLPKVFGGFSTYFRYKGFDVSATFDYQLGGKVYDQMYAALMTPSVSGSDAGSAIHKDIFNSWSPNNTSSNIPRWQYGDNYTTAKSTRFLTSAKYLNFQSFMVGYTLPKGLIPLVSSVRVYCVGENLCFWSARKGLDPRYSYDGNGYTGTYSPTRNISGGIQVTF